jgi:hypothetical protein
MLMVHMNSDATWAHTTIAKRTQQLITSGVNDCRLRWRSITFEVLRKRLCSASFNLYAARCIITLDSI